jgi:hypothetical protein
MLQRFESLTADGVRDEIFFLPISIYGQISSHGIEKTSCAVENASVYILDFLPPTCTSEACPQQRNGNNSTLTEKQGFFCCLLLTNSLPTFLPPEKKSRKPFKLQNQKHKSLVREQKRMLNESFMKILSTP